MPPARCSLRNVLTVIVILTLTFLLGGAVAMEKPEVPATVLKEQNLGLTLGIYITLLIIMVGLGVYVYLPVNNNNQQDTGRHRTGSRSP